MSRFTQAKIRRAEQSAAWHEAGHALSTLLVGGGPPLVVCITNLPAHTAGCGGVCMTIESTPRNDLIVSAAGAAAELLLSEQASELWAENDRLLAASKTPAISATGVGGGIEVDAGGVLACASGVVKRVLAAPQNDWDRMAGIVVESGLDKQMKVSRWQRWAVDKADRLLSKHLPALCAIARALLSEKALLGSRVVELKHNAG
jgi:hypothetical protein